MYWEIRVAGWLWVAGLVLTICLGLNQDPPKVAWQPVTGGTVLLALVALLSSPVRSGRFNAPSFLSAFGIALVMACASLMFGEGKVASVIVIAGLGIALVFAFVDDKRHWQSCRFFSGLARGEWWR
ncbi:MAG: hypothetical protein V1685_06285 [Parcubacteria group bacterium]